MRADLWTIEDFVDDKFCANLIERAVKVGFETASITTPSGPVIRMDYRHNDRVIFDDPDLAASLWERLKGDPHLDTPGWKPIGLNERIRVYRYSGEDQYFAAHYDAHFVREAGQEQSWVTLLVYLNDGFVGGETVFQDGTIVVPKTGRAALMTQGNYLHEALEVPKGAKYVLRTDVMYRAKKEEA